MKPLPAFSLHAGRFLTLLACLFTSTVAWAAQPTAEIETLLGYLKNLDGAVFIRNGSEHTAAEGEAHLRMKWEKQAEKIKTAEDFILLCGSKSSQSGQRYQIRFKDGTLQYSDEVLTRQLGEIRRMAAPGKG